MLFTNIPLDDFVPTLGRFLEYVELEGAEEREWIMELVNITAMLEYGRPSSLLRKSGELGSGGLGAIGVMSNKPAASMSRHQHQGAQKEKIDIDDGLDKDHDTAMKSPSLYSVTSNHSTDPHAHTSTSSTPTPNVQLPLQLKYAFQLTFSLLLHVLQLLSINEEARLPHRCTQFQIATIKVAQ
jgi:hypothetical protein